MGALSDGDGGQPAGDEIGDVGVFRQNQSERPRPEGVGEFVDRFGDVLGHDRNVFQVAARGDVDDEWIKRWSLFGGKNLGDGIGVEGICGEAVNGFGRQGNDFAGTQQFASLAHGFLHFVIGNLENSGLGHAAVLPEPRASGEPRISEMCERPTFYGLSPRGSGVRVAV